ncbi:MAG TPA: hypothetical protein VL981_12450 [Candidatus Methylacidiphilales bacterium]|nr:hypothetical protein [Candidatus Methylacidiphilales bacterium]
MPLMLHFRVIASIWLLLGLLGLVLSIRECLRLLQVGESLADNAVESTFIAFGFCALAITTSIGFFRTRRWVRYIGSITAILFGFYCLSIIAMTGIEFGVLVYGMSWLGMAFMIYTLTVICAHGRQ